MRQMQGEIMNAIQCKNCMDILAPLMKAKVRTCFCGAVQMRALPENEQYDNNGHSVIVEMKIHFGDAQVLKIHNNFLRGEHGVHDITDEYNNLFYQNQSQIVIAPLDTPGVKVVDEWSNRFLQSSKGYLNRNNVAKTWYDKGSHMRIIKVVGK
jgi:hypothetical protein